MKKFALVTGLILCAGIGYGDSDLPFQISGSLGPSFTTATSAVTSSTTIVAAGAGQRNCLTDWTLMSTTVSNMTIYDGILNSGTTIWGLTSVPASTVVSKDSERRNALCGSFNTQMQILVSSGTVSISYRGHTRKTP